MSPNQDKEKAVSPNEDLAIPKWINENYFQEILQTDVPNYQRIINFKPVAATAPGENYTSIMVRVLMDIELKDGSTQPISYILKTCFETGDGAALIKTMNLFPREKQMYQIHLPKFTQLYKDAGANVKLGPKCFRVEETPERTTLVMEDLKRQNYENVDRLKGMDFAHSAVVLQKLAELHAASAVYHEVNGPFDPIYLSSFFSEANRPIFAALGNTRQQSFFRAMRTWNLPNVEIYIANTPPPSKTFDEGLRLNQADPNEFNVLNHGDCWVNNIMFKHKDNGEIDDAIFVDFQIGKWGTPTQDLWYFIVTSIDLDIKLKEFDHFIHIYHKRLVECLKVLKYSKPIPTLKELHILMLKYGYWAILTMNGVLSAILYPSDKDANMENIMKQGPEGDEFRHKIFTNPYYVKACCQLFKFFDIKGLWELSEAS